ncbi:hypothetical protein ACE1B4_18065 [Aeromonas veronii]|uniref:hypothetical protein n=1 Tax=Aeromonas veronii TaxID=654 RepID=UPI0011179F3D|nr:hypothetical protein [Aeromonas veronii]TNI05216.1 hypothetical protein CF135_13295 [Aeromonas veronii]HDO1312095.1 hypothetical protein [Aeromonas veronii]
MTWHQGHLVWPASAGALHEAANGVTSQIPDAQSAAVNRLQGLAGRAQYRPHPLSEAAAALAELRGELDRLLVTGRSLTVTPYQHGVGQHQGNQYSLSAHNAVATLATKLQDGADPLLPAGQLHAIAWLVTGNSTEALTMALAPICTVLPLPEWCATLRRLTASNDTMSQPTAAKVPRWKADEPLSWDPLRPARMALGAELAQLESLAQDGTTPIAKLAALAARREERLAAMTQALHQLASISGQLWHWQGQGDAASLAAQLGQSSPPDHSHSMTVGALLLSPSPQTFWQELTR